MKQLIAVAADTGGGLALLRKSRTLRGPEVRIFGYHRVVEDVSAASRVNMPPLCVSTATFAAHCDHLKACYEVLALEEAVDVLEGRRRAPAKPVAVITFDDGYLDVLTLAAPILAARGLPATVFVTTDVVTTARPFAHDRIFALCHRAHRAGARLLGIPVGDEATWPLARADHALERGDVMAAAEAILLGLPGKIGDQVADALAARLGEPTPDELAPLMGWDDLRKLPALGVDVQSHCVSHGHLPLEDEAGLVRELREARAEIGLRMGRTPIALAYPAGRYDERVIAAALKAGYRIALTTEDHANRPGADLMRLGRKVVSEAHGGVAGTPKPALVAAHLDGLFNALGLSRAVDGTAGPARPWDLVT